MRIIRQISLYLARRMMNIYFMEKVEISVVVPVYKVEVYLNRCVDSILTQTFQNLEVILVNDGSPDNSGMICEDYLRQDCRVKVIHQSNKGVTAARKLGLEIAVGKYVCFVDGDDYLLEDSLQVLYDIVESENLDIVMGSYEERSEDGNVLNKIYYQQKEYTGREFVEVLSAGLNNALWGCLYRKNLFDVDTLNIPSEIKRGEDLIMKIRLALKAKRIKVVSDIVYCYVQRRSSVMHTFKPTLGYWKLYHSHLFPPSQNSINKKWLEKIKIQYALYLLRSVLTDDFDPRDPWLLGIEEAVRRLRFPLKKRLYLRLFTSPFARRVILFAHRYHLKDRLQACLGRGKK